MAGQASAKGKDDRIIQWEPVPGKGGGTWFTMQRAKVPGGWLVHSSYGTGTGLTFYPDPTHSWDGKAVR